MISSFFCSNFFDVVDDTIPRTKWRAIFRTCSKIVEHNIAVLMRTYANQPKICVFLNWYLSKTWQCWLSLLNHNFNSRNPPFPWIATRHIYWCLFMSSWSHFIYISFSQRFIPSIPHSILLYTSLLQVIRIKMAAFSKLHLPLAVILPALKLISATVADLPITNLSGPVVPSQSLAPSDGPGITSTIRTSAYHHPGQPSRPPQTTNSPPCTDSIHPRPSPISTITRSYAYHPHPHPRPISPPEFITLESGNGGLIEVPIPHGIFTQLGAERTFLAVPAPFNLVSAGNSHGNPHTGTPFPTCTCHGPTHTCSSTVTTTSIPSHGTNLHGSATPTTIPSRSSTPAPSIPTTQPPHSQPRSSATPAPTSTPPIHSHGGNHTWTDWIPSASMTSSPHPTQTITVRDAQSHYHPSMTPPDDVTRTWIDWTPAASNYHGPYITLPLPERDLDVDLATTALHPTAFCTERDVEVDVATPTPYQTAFYTERDMETAEVLESVKPSFSSMSDAEFLNTGPMIPTLTGSFPTLVTKAAVAEVAVTPAGEENGWPGNEDGVIVGIPTYITKDTGRFRRPITFARVVKSATLED
jgi:hypothetical protein